MTLLTYMVKGLFNVDIWVHMSKSFVCEGLHASV